jgi:cytoskeletal protein RodZ
MEPGANGVLRNPEGAEASLGMFLLASREKRGVTREEAARDARIPAHYLRMLESNDYSMIADQLYLLPFLRRYAEYLRLDSEDAAIRFVREVQRAENSPGPALPSAIDPEGGPTNVWVILGAITIVAVVAGWMVLHQRHHLQGDETADISTQRAAIPNDSSGPPLPESVQGGAQSDVQQTVPAASSVSANEAPARGHPLPQPAAVTQHDTPGHPAAQPIPPPGGTE